MTQAGGADVAGSGGLRATVRLRFRRIADTLGRPVARHSVDWFVRGLGLLLLVSALRFVRKGWVDELLVVPTRLHYPLLSWVPHPGRWGVFTLWGLVACGGLALGLRPRARWAALLALSAFAWLEFIEISTYLNHYYLVTVLLLLVALLPTASADTLPRWGLFALRAQLSLVYTFAGLAKLNPEWLCEAEPMRTWLFARSELPLVGTWLIHPVTAYTFAWFGALYDLFLPWALSWAKTRKLGLVAALGFHAATSVLFEIGLFPWIMLLGVTLFLPPDWPATLKRRLRPRAGPSQLVTGALRGGGAPGPGTPLRAGMPAGTSSGLIRGARPPRAWNAGAVALVLLWQLLFPLRQWLYPGERLWTEQGFRFAWNVMLLEKAGHMEFDLVGGPGAPRVSETGADLLTPFQYKTAATQPDLILQVAHLLGERYQRRYGKRPRVFAHVWVSFNGRPRHRLVDPEIDLFAEHDGLGPKRWILPLPPRPPRAGAPF